MYFGSIIRHISIDMNIRYDLVSTVMLCENWLENEMWDINFENVKYRD